MIPTPPGRRSAAETGKGLKMYTVLAPAAHGRRNLEQAQAVVVAHGPRRGAGQVGDLGDSHGLIPAGDATSPSSRHPRTASRPSGGRRPCPAGPRASRPCLVGAGRTLGHSGS